ncbi:type II toxin-antitoxin system VapC family toxin [Xanthobacteraceae bacterium Astr-EGSB]|uniref:type II toxin-antitoxin system VapC family toxin n=1 Tax=Astrobacterium formosum TaxID=3069710 RepID=UPI0027B1D508|nr:type II toxin-antitoxin system VapC family toxin [Xanthobacteraceae bacterium Astr-EGSB]
MSGILLDTNALVWFASGDPMDPYALSAIASAQEASLVFVSPISAWEAALAARKRNNQPNLSGLAPSAWFKAALALPGVRMVTVNRRIALEAASVPPVYGNGDPGDCFLIATARIRKLRIVTRDGAMIGLSQVNPSYLQTIPC